MKKSWLVLIGLTMAAAILVVFYIFRDKPVFVFGTGADNNDQTTAAIKPAGLLDTFKEDKTENYFKDLRSAGCFIAVEKASVFNDTITSDEKCGLVLGDTIIPKNMYGTTLDSIPPGPDGEFEGVFFPDTFYKIYYKKNNSIDSGFVKGSNLAIGFFIDSANKSKGVFALRYLSYINPDYPGNPAELLYFQNGKIVSRMKFSSYALLYIGKMTPDRSFAPGLQFFQITGAPDACGSICHTLFFQNGNLIDTVFTRWIWENADSDWADDDYIFPWNRYGKPGEVGLYYREFESDSLDHYVLLKRQYERYRFQNGKFQMKNN
jgi:hypothetical protein